MNPDRTVRNPNLMRWRDRLWLIDHGAALGFQYVWSSVSEETPRKPFIVWEPHLLRDRAAKVAEWDELFASRLTREAIEATVASVPDSLLEPLLPVSDR